MAAPEPDAAGTRRGFLVGLAIPFLGIVIAGVLWWTAAGDGPGGDPAEISVRARSEVPLEPVSAPPSPRTDPGVITPAGDLALQVASFRTRRRAEEVLAEAQVLTGLTGLVAPGEVDGVRWYRILLGTFATVEDAQKAAEPLLREGLILDTLVRPIPPRWADALARPNVP